MPTILRIRQQQTGATAVEFALVFPVFLLLFYGILSYGLIFLMRMALQHSAEDGVRAGLHHQVVTYPLNSTPAEKRAAQLQARVAVAKSVAAQQASWLNGWAAPVIAANVCSNTLKCVPTTGVATYPDCSETTGCQLVISLRYDYAAHPMIPTLPGFGLIVPAQLEGRARVLIDGRALSS